MEKEKETERGRERKRGVTGKKKKGPRKRK